MNYGTKFCRLCLKILLPTILTSSLPFYPYQKDEWALPGYLLTRCSFSSSDIKRLSLSPRCFLFSSTLILSFLTLSLSLSLRLQSVKGWSSKRRIFTQSLRLMIWLLVRKSSLLQGGCQKVRWLSEREEEQENLHCRELLLPLMFLPLPPSLLLEATHQSAWYARQLRRHEPRKARSNFNSGVNEVSTPTLPVVSCVQTEVHEWYDVTPTNVSSGPCCSLSVLTLQRDSWTRSPSH
jgi:hypothetical protein